LSKLLAALLLFACAQILSAQASFTEFEYKKVGSIQIHADGPVDQEFILKLIEITPNTDILTIPKIRRSIELLYETGNFTNILVDAEIVNDRVQLTFDVRLIYRFEFIHLRGHKGISSGKLKKKIQLRKLEPYTPEKVLKAREEILQELQANGFYGARVSHDVLLRRTRKRAEVTFQINAGPPAYVGNVNFSGNPVFHPQQLLTKMKSRPGKRFKELEFKKDLEKLKEYYKKNGYIENTITVPKQNLDSSNRMDLEIEIQAGKEVLLSASGYEISTDKLDQLIPIREEETYSDDILEDGKRNLVRFMQQEGYYEAQATFTKTQEEEKVLITYEITPGTRYEVQEILISGNTHISADEIRAVMRTKESGFKVKRLVTDIFENDQKNILSLYHQQGFLFARLIKKELLKLPNGKINLDLQLEEGPQSILSEIRLKGNQAFSTEQLMQLFKLRIGEPVSESTVQQDTSLLVAHYSDNGYAKVSVESKLLLSRDKTRAIIEYRLNEGEQIFVDRIVISGNYRTKRKVIEKNLYFEEQDPLSMRKIIQSQGELYSLDIFDKAQIDVPRPDYLQKNQNILIRLKETKPYTISYGIGYQTFDKLRGLFSITNRNLFGDDISVNLLLRGGFKENRIVVSAFDPDMFARRLYTTIAATYENRALDAFSFRRYAGTIQIEKKLSGPNVYLPVGAKIPPLKSLFFNYTYEDIKTTEGTPSLDPEDIPFLPIDISSISTTFARDARDNAIDPVRGNFFSAKVQYASKLLGSKTDFLKFQTEYLHFLPLDRTILATALRIGLAGAFRDTVVPISQHFFAGGEHTIRGFAQDTAGPVNEQGEGLGGNASFIANVEERFPLFGQLGGVIFFDYGFVFADIEDFSFGGLRPCAGFGIRYITPIGPLALDWGFKLDRQPGESSNEIYFSVGHAF
jgi:outer membrane protein insertion porin family